MIALKYKQNNSELNKNHKAKKETINMLREGDKILKNTILRFINSKI